MQTIIYCFDYQAEKAINAYRPNHEGAALTALGSSWNDNGKA